MEGRAWGVWRIAILKNRKPVNVITDVLPKLHFDGKQSPSLAGVRKFLNFLQ